MKKIVLAGDAITACAIGEYLAADPRYQMVARTVDDEYLASTPTQGLPVVGVSQLPVSYPSSEVSIIMAMGYGGLNRNREGLFLRLRSAGYHIESYVHPQARVFSRKELGEGCVILPGAVVEPNAEVGANTFVWCNVTLAHDCSVGDHCWIASGSVISGQAKVHRNSFVGVNATVVNDVVIGAYNIIGAGALITKCTKENSVHLARSAEVLRYSADDYVKHLWG